MGACPGVWVASTAFMVVGLLALVAAAAGARLSVHLHAVASAVDTEMATPQAMAGTTPTRVKATSAKHGRTAPLLPVATHRGAWSRSILYGFRAAGAAAGPRTATAPGLVEPVLSGSSCTSHGLIRRRARRHP